MRVADLDPNHGARAWLNGLATGIGLKAWRRAGPVEPAVERLATEHEQRSAEAYRRKATMPDLELAEQLAAPRRAQRSGASPLKPGFRRGVHILAESPDATIHPGGWLLQRCQSVRRAS